LGIGASVEVENLHDVRRGVGDEDALVAVGADSHRVLQRLRGCRSEQRRAKPFKRGDRRLEIGAAGQLADVADPCRLGRRRPARSVEALGKYHAGIVGATGQHHQARD
jgi:hypothetical protein